MVCAPCLASTTHSLRKIVVKPSTVLSFHRALIHRKYRLLFSPKNRSKPGPKGPDQDLIKAVIEIKQRNPRWGCPHIAEQLALAFGVLINKDVVRRIWLCTTSRLIAVPVRLG
jgi:putative transposase